MNDIFLGGIEVAILVTVILFGMVTVQVFVYYSNFPDDSRIIKTLLAIIWVIEAGHVGALCYGLYTCTVAKYGVPDIPVPKEMYSAAILGSVAHPLVQAIFIARIRQLASNSVNRFFTAAAWGVSGFNFGATVLLSIKIFSVQTLDQFEDQWSWFMLARLASTVAVDLIIFGAMLYCTAHSHPSEYVHVFCLFSASEQHTSVNHLDKLVLFTAQTGLCLVIMSAAVLVMFSLLKHNRKSVASYTRFEHRRYLNFLLQANVNLSEYLVYSNSLLSLLNGRLHLGFKPDLPFTISLSTLHNQTSPRNDSIPPATHLKPPIQTPLTSPASLKPSSLAHSSIHFSAQLDSPKSKHEMV
ncbi:hypothetical protein MIND_00226600 [Mycena indigotica]|uniref:Uncharacterized protein n=1 Tax=Mycena indigotica TaxID=2126181 RepID=A0A8H6T877_9AGAR|nr:uncharacterized protein MIND_00226600 [Mycena indigotica]KAF7312142.1 hypothetical protein MIND_00226600 [Mycena indigotica]